MKKCFIIWKIFYIYLTNIDTKYVKNMSMMLEGCRSLVLLDISTFNTSSVIDMRCMFCYCNSLISLNLENFNTYLLLIWDLCFVVVFH